MRGRVRGSAPHEGGGVRLTMRNNEKSEKGTGDSDFVHPWTQQFLLHLQQETPAVEVDGCTGDIAGMVGCEKQH